MVLRWIHAPERGASALEYVGLVVLAGALIAALFVVLPDDYGSRIADAMRPGGGTRDSGSAPGEGGSGPQSSRGTDGKGSDAHLKSASKSAGKGDDEGDDGVNEEWWDDSGTWGSPSDKMPIFGFQDRGNYNWDCGQLLDGFCKIGGGLYKGVREQTDAACLTYVCGVQKGNDSWKGMWEGTKKVFTDPGGAAEEMWKGFKEPFDEAAKKGGGFKNFGYALPAAVGGVAAPFKATKKLKDTHKERRHKKNDERKLENQKPKERTSRNQFAHSRDAAREGDVKAAKQYAENNEKLVKKAQKKVKKNPSSTNRKKLEEAELWAKKTNLQLKGARGFAYMMRTDTGRDLQKFMKEKNVDVHFSDDPDLDGVAKHDGAVTVGQGRMRKPRHTGLDLVHELQHARRDRSGRNLHPTLVSKEKYIDDRLDDEAESQLAEFRMKNELREKGEEVKKNEAERVYDESYKESKRKLDEVGVEEKQKEKMARLGAKKELAKHIGGMTESVEGKKYNDYYGDSWERANRDRN